MAHTEFTRLRQVCLATLNLKQEEAALSQILGLEPCHRSQLDDFGLENSLFAINGSFIELVAPTRDETAVHRFLSKNEGVGGYMAIFDCHDVQDKKAAAAKADIHPVLERSGDKADLLQLNPKQTGITLLEFDHHYGGDDLLGHYEWAGENWQDKIITELTRDMVSVTMSCANPEARALQWSPLFGKAPSAKGSGFVELSLDHGTVCFVRNHRSKTDHFSSLTLTVSCPDTVLANALSQGYFVTGNSFSYCGISIEVTAA